MIKEILETDLKAAIKGRNSAVKNVIRQVFTRINKFEKESSSDISDSMLLTLLTKELKEVKATLEFAKENVDVLKQKAYLVSLFNQFSPKQISSKEIQDVVNAIVDTMDEEKSMKSMKFVISTFNDLFPGQDMKIVSSEIKKALNS